MLVIPCRCTSALALRHVTVLCPAVCSVHAHHSHRSHIQRQHACAATVARCEEQHLGHVPPALSDCSTPWAAHLCQPVAAHITSFAGPYNCTQNSRHAQANTIDSSTCWSLRRCYLEQRRQQIPPRSPTLQHKQLEGMVTAAMPLIAYLAHNFSSGVNGGGGWR